jgi:hypothetical protein
LEDAAGPLALRAWAASHLAPFFGYVYRPLLQAGRKIDLLLEILATGSPGGEIVADSRETYVGATYLLSMMRNFTNYRSSQVEESLHEAVKQLASFPPTASPIAVASIFTESLPGGDESPRIHALHLDWTTLSAVAAAQGAQRGANPGWTFRRWPGLNHYWQRGVLNSHQSDVIGLWARRPAAASPPATAPSRPRVAVIIPCHNLGIYLPEALESVFAQTAQNIEIIVVDDGSTDEITRRLLELVCGRTVRLIQQTNQGLAAARNAGIRACTAEYVCCLDPDDKLTAEFLERALKILEDQPDAGFVSTSYKTFDEREDLVAHASCGFPELLAENCAMVSSLFRKVAWERAGGYYGGFPVPGFEDWDLWITFVEQGWRAHVTTEPLFLYRVRPDSMYRSAGSDSGKLEQTFHILAQRHRDSYQRHAPEVVAKVRVALTRLQDFIRFEGQARAWSDNQLDRWQAIANTREQSMFSLAQRIDQLEMGKRWLTAQVESWKEEHRKCQEVIQLQKGWIEELERGKRWLEEQHALLKAKSETGTPERPNETGGDRDVEI